MERVLYGASHPHSSLCAADTLPRGGEQERKNPMALYILKDKVSTLGSVPHKHIVSPTAFRGARATWNCSLFIALRGTLGNICVTCPLGLRKIRLTEVK